MSSRCRQKWRHSRTAHDIATAGCSDDHSEHISTLCSERPWRLVLNALDPANTQPEPSFYVAPFVPWVR